MNIIQAVTLLHAIAEKGPTPAMYANVSEMFKVLHTSGTSKDEINARFVGPSFKTHADVWDGFSYYNFVQRIFSQPYGYAGDWELLSKMYEAYDRYYKSWMLGRFVKFPKVGVSKWDEYMLSLPCGQAVMNREQYLINAIGKLIREKKVTKVLDIACGNGRLLNKLAIEHPHCIFAGIDVEPLAIKDANDGRAQNTAFGVVNALQKLPTEQFDLVVSAGLTDYLTDRHFTRLVRRIEKYLDPKYVIIGNMTEHRAIPEMELLGWNLVYRDSIHLMSLAVNTFRGKRFRVGKECTGVNLFLHIEPKE